MRMIVAGNWKMHKDEEGTRALVKNLREGLAGQSTAVEVVIAPPFPFIKVAVEEARGSRISVAAQNCHAAAQGAFTGEVSVPMLKSLGVGHCIVGHSERRQYFGETDEQVAGKIKALLVQDITPIYCCGEVRQERESGRHFEVVSAQMRAALHGLTMEELRRVVIAYEPVWAIGTGLTATEQQAQDMHAHIRELLRSHGAGVAEAVPVLYGGSCKPDNAAGLFGQPDVNGGLIGGAALVADQFLALIAIADRSIS